jgi:thiamine-monophosphate kinase
LSRVIYGKDPMVLSKVPEKKLGEFDLIKWLIKKYSEDGGIISKSFGDDAIWETISPGYELLITTDLLIEDIHFNLDYTNAFNLGYKSLAVNLSDIAAMGGIPRFFLISLGIPKYISLNFLEEFYKGLNHLSRNYKIALAGGDTSKSEYFTINIVLIGEVPFSEKIRRDTAKAGDLIYVTGSIGDSALGLKILKNGSDPQKNKAQIKKHLTPTPRIEIARAIAKNHLATSMIDISDGIIADLNHILEGSNLGAEIRLDWVPFSSNIDTNSINTLDSPEKNIILALSGGEDYELLFTSPLTFKKKISQISTQFNIPINCIGNTTNAKGELKIINHEHKQMDILVKGFDHFNLE